MSIFELLMVQVAIGVILCVVLRQSAFKATELDLLMARLIAACDGDTEKAWLLIDDERKLDSCSMTIDAVRSVLNRIEQSKR
ncbi:hypothetical protein [Methylobacillus sp.]|uniref:hypothetical protein n=1 Tax=Methylobacillus sp. TaxID=56818 RepID=UPI0012C3222A|nr:hypothetical protein [Methylobacillus sp.]MPS49041.1 hypothetical protein [Methylobacillus sp.]